MIEKCRQQGGISHKVDNDSEPLWGRLQPDRRAEHDFLRKRGAAEWARDEFCKEMKKLVASDRILAMSWYPRRESNPQFTLRRGMLYPFNYGGI